VIFLVLGVLSGDSALVILFSVFFEGIGVSGFETASRTYLSVRAFVCF
jgi:hypothetical protein